MPITKFILRIGPFVNYFSENLWGVADFPETMAEIADGAIVGSAIIKLIEKHGTGAPKVVGEYVQSLKREILEKSVDIYFERV